MKQLVNCVTHSCFFQLRLLPQMRRDAGSEVTKRLASAFILSKLDYCNAALSGLPQTNLRSLQRVQNAAVRLVTNTGSRDHITPVLKDLHWLPVNQRMKYKLCLMVHQVHIQQCLSGLHAGSRYIDRNRCHEKRASFSQWSIQPKTCCPHTVRWTPFQLLRTCCLELTISLSAINDQH